MKRKNNDENIQQVTPHNSKRRKIDTQKHELKQSSRTRVKKNNKKQQITHASRELLYETLLNPDLIYIICQFMTWDEIWRCGTCTCRVWHDTITSPAFLTFRDLHLHNTNSNVIDGLVTWILSKKWRFYMRSLILSSFNSNSCHRLASMIQSMRNGQFDSLQSLKLYNLQSEDRILKQLIQKKRQFEGLREVHIENCRIPIETFSTFINFKPFEGKLSKHSLQMKPVLENAMQYLQKQVNSAAIKQNSKAQWQYVAQLEFNADAPNTRMSFTLMNKIAKVLIHVNCDTMQVEKTFIESLCLDGWNLNLVETPVLQYDHMKELSLTDFTTSSHIMPVLIVPKVQNFVLSSTSNAGLKRVDLLLPSVEHCTINITGPTDITLRNLDHIKQLSIDAPKCTDIRLSTCSSQALNGSFLANCLHHCSKSLQILFLNKMEALDVVNLENLFALTSLVVSDCPSLTQISCLHSRALSSLYIHKCSLLRQGKFYVQRNRMKRYHVQGVHEKCIMEFDCR